MSVFLFGASFFLLLLGIYPFTVYPASLWLIRHFHKRPISNRSAENLSFAICVCAYNEERVIEDKVRNMLDLRRVIPDLQVLVYVDAASDQTATILQRYADQITLHVSPDRHGKTYGLNLLVSMSNADIIIFTDANVIIDADSAFNLAKYYADPDVGCVLGQLIYVNGDSTPTAGIGALYWRYEEWLKQLESDTGSAMGADGSIFSIRRRLHHRTPDRLFDDMYVSMSILCDGYRIVRAPEVLAYERGATSFTEEYNRKIRIACQALNVHRELWPQLRQLDAFNFYKYIAHKFIRWNCIWLLLASGMLIELDLFVAGYPMLAIVLPTLGAVVLFGGRVLHIPGLTQLFEAIAAFWAMGIGVVCSLRGVYFQTWTPAKSIRETTVRDRSN